MVCAAVYMDSRWITLFIDSFPKILLQGIAVTIPLTAVSFLLALILAVVAAMIQFTRVPVLRQLCRIYIWIFRGTPILVQLFVVFYGLPHVGILLNPFPAAVLVFTLNEGAYSAETIRASLEAVQAGQLEAGYCVGMTFLQTMRRIVLPQAMRTAFPPLSNSLIAMVKDTSLAANITVTEMFMVTQRIVARTYEPLLLYLEVGLIYLLLCGCGAGTDGGGAAESTSVSETSAENESQDLLAKIESRGTITVAMEGTWAPWTYHDEKDVLVGYDVEVAEKIAEKLGVKAEFIEGEWDGLLAGLEDGRYDIMVNGVDLTEERAKKYDFSIPYAHNRTVVITTGENDTITKMDDLKGKHTANTISSTYAETAERYGADVTGVDDLNQTMELLLGGRIDATLNAEVTFYDYLKAHPDADIKIAATDPKETIVAIPVRKGAETERLLAKIDQALTELGSSGELTELSEKYFGTDISGS